MFVPIIAALALSQVPKTYEELEIEEIKAYHGLKTFHEDMEVKMVDSEGTQTISRNTLIDGNRIHVNMLGAGNRIEQIGDGATEWAILHSKQIYIETKPDYGAFDAKALLPKAEAGSYNLSLSAEGPLLMACDPPPVIKSIETVHEDKQDLRKVVAVTSDDKGHHLTMTEWFLPDRWLLQRVSMHGLGMRGTFSLEATAAALDFNATVRPSDFVLDPSIVKGYQKVDPQGRPSPER